MIESNIKAKLSFSDGTPDIELPIYKGTQGPDVIDIRKLYGQIKASYSIGVTPLKSLPLNATS
jgi:citrate synthase